MEYQVTATRRRPQNLEQLSGQTFVQQTLQNAISSGHIAHAYLFSGPRGVGKTSAARILAKALNCEQGPTSTPCGHCSNCQEILKGKAIDVIEIDGASHTGVDDIREIKEEVLYAPGSFRYKVFIIDEVHMLSNSAFNALLKTIEEPPEYIIFIFATTEIHKVPLTVRSRCQHYHFHLVSLDLIRENLAIACAEIGLEYCDQALIWIAREAKGSMRDAYTLFDQVVSFCAGQRLSLELIQDKMGLIAIDQLSKLCDALVDLNLDMAIGLYQEILYGGTSLEQLLIDLCEYLRALLLLQSGLSEQQLLLLLPYPSNYYSMKARQHWNREQLCHILERCFGLYRNLRYSLNEQFEFELLLFELSQLHYYSTGAHQLQRLEQLATDLKNGIVNIEPEQETRKETKSEKKNSDFSNFSKVQETSLSETLPADIPNKSVHDADRAPVIDVDNIPSIAAMVQPEVRAELESNELNRSSDETRNKSESITSSASNVQCQLQEKIIELLQATKPQLAKYLSTAYWTWQSETKSLGITLSNLEVQQSLKNSNSVLLRLFQKALEGSTMATITKLSFYYQPISVPQSPQSVEQKPELYSQVSQESKAEETKTSSISDDMGIVSEHSNLPEHFPVPVEEVHSENLAEITAGSAIIASALPESIGPINSKQAEKIESGERIIEDYSQLPTDIQILQRVLLAKVREVTVK